MPSLSLKEAAVLAGVPEAAVRKAIEARTIRPHVAVAGRAPRYRFHGTDLVYLKLVTGFPLALKAEDKRALRELIEERRPASGRWLMRGRDLMVRADDLEVRVGLARLRSALARRLRAYHRGRARIVTNPAIVGGEPVFEGTRIPLRHVAGLIAKGVSLEELAEDYPALSTDDLEFATMVARMKPDPGRPRKPLALVRDGLPVATLDTPVRPLRATAH